jgi:hypothetical protein
VNFRPSALSPARLKIVTEPAAEVWMAADAEVISAFKLDADDDARLNMVLKASRKYFERITGLALITQTLRVSFDYVPQVRRPAAGGAWPILSPFDFSGNLSEREIEFPRAPLVSVDAVQYKNEAGTLTTFASSNYTAGEVGVATAFGRLWLDDDADWPDLGQFPAALQVEFKAGFGTAATDVPEDIRIAILQLAAHWYENALPVNVGNIVNEMPHSLESLIAMHRVAFVA